MENKNTFFASLIKLAFIYNYTNRPGKTPLYCPVASGNSRRILQITQEGITLRLPAPSEPCVRSVRISCISTMPHSLVAAVKVHGEVLSSQHHHHVDDVAIKNHRSHLLKRKRSHFKKKKYLYIASKVPSTLNSAI